MRHNMASDITAGIGSALAILPLIVVVGFIAFGALGPQAATTMSIAVFVSNMVAGVVVLLLSRCPILVAATSGSSALVMAALFKGMVDRGIVPDVADAMAITLCVAAVAGVVQMALIKAGAAGLGPLAPYPVVAGLVNGTAVLLVLSQASALLAHPAEVAVALATTATMLWFPIRWKVPQVLPAVAAGVVVYAMFHAFNVEAGPALAAMPSPAAYPVMAVGAFSALLSHGGLLPWRAIVTAGVTVAVLGVLETLATVSALTDAGIPTEGRRDLTAVSVGNLAVAVAAGGPPISAPVGSALGLLRLGGSGRLAPVSRLVTLGLGGTFLGGLLPLVPQGAMVGLVLAIGVRLFDTEPLRLLWRAACQDTPHRVEIAGSAVISLVVVGVAVFEGLAVAVAVGAVACLLVFTAAMGGSAVRRVFDGAAAMSRVRRSSEETEALLRERHAVAVLELAGPLFFGNVSPLGRALEQAQGAGAREVVIDLSRIVRVDLSGARRLISTVRQYRQQGLRVVLAPIRPGHPVADYLAALGVEPGECYAETNQALAAAEAVVLAEAGIPQPSFATAEQALRALGVAPEHAKALALRAETRDLAAGEVLCRGGEPADAVFVLMQGEADVLLPLSSDTPRDVGRNRVLLAKLLAGAVIGERALFEAGVRTADVVCPIPSRALILHSATLAALIEEASAASLALVLAIAHSTTISLQLANAAIQRLEV
jgi:sulfate permease, SulP family